MCQLTINNRFSEMFGSLDIIKTDDDKILFKANDILRALGYKEGNWRTTLSRKCKGVTKCNVPHPQSPSKEIEVNFITEGDVYRLIANSKLPQAEQFEKWVMDEILPSIRKHGAYLTPETLEKTMQDPDFLIGVLTNLKEEQLKRRQAEQLNKVQAETIKLQAPKVKYHDEVLNCDKLVTTSEIAKDAGISAQALNKILNQEHIIYKAKSGNWMFYSEHQNKVPEYADYYIHEHGQHLKWTELGRKWILEDILNIVVHTA